MARIRHAWVALVLASILHLGGGLARADSPVAILNHTKEFDSSSAKSDDLWADARDATIQATSAARIQGYKDSHITVITTQGSGTVHVADVVDRQGDSFYTVTGIYIGEGGKPATWTTGYNKGVARILLTVNTSSTDDDLIGSGVWWTELEVRLVHGTTGTTYTVSNLRTTGAGAVDFGDSGTTLTTASPVVVFYVQGTANGLVTISADCDHETTVVPTTATIVKPIKNPDGEPTTTAGANDTNEITFTAGGLAFVFCDANRVIPDPGDFRWRIWNAGTITAQWNSYIANDKTIGVGQSPMVTYDGMPTYNSDFGKKTITLAAVNKAGNDWQDIELFFPRDEANHPGGQADSPNWFYYWSQLHVNDNVRYVADAGQGQTPGIVNWAYAAAQDKTSIKIGNGHPDKFRSYGVGKECSGIDRYIMSVIHEEKHVNQIARADQLMPTSSGNDAFRYGWSWNQTTHNHWKKGPDGQWGVAGVDDDGNGVVDDATPSPPFEPGHGDDVSLNYINSGPYRDWPAAWAVPQGFSENPGMLKLEVEAVRAADATMNENDYARQDWGDPGKNHATLDKWDD